MMMSRLMLNLHAAASTGILSVAPTLRVAFTSHAPDNLQFEMQPTVPPAQSLQAVAEHIVQEIEAPEIEVEQRSGVWYMIGAEVI